MLQLADQKEEKSSLIIGLKKDHNPWKWTRVREMGSVNQQMKRKLCLHMFVKIQAVNGENMFLKSICLKLHVEP